MTLYLTEKKLLLGSFFCSVGGFEHKISTPAEKLIYSRSGEINPGHGWLKGDLYPELAMDCSEAL